MTAAQRESLQFLREHSNMPARYFHHAVLKALVARGWAEETYGCDGRYFCATAAGLTALEEWEGGG